MARRYRLDPPSSSDSDQPEGFPGSSAIAAAGINLKLPTRFLAEVQIVLSFLIIIGCMFAMIFYPKNPESKRAKVFSEQHYEYRSGLIFFLSVTIVANLLDLGLACLLIYATKKSNEELTLIWWRGTLSALVIYSFQTIAFAIGLSTLLVFLTVLPGLIFKPFALWVVNGFIANLYRRADRRRLTNVKYYTKTTTLSYIDEDDLEYEDPDIFSEDEIDGPGPGLSTTVVIVEEGNDNCNEEFELRESSLSKTKTKPSGDFVPGTGRAPIVSQETDQL